MDSVLDSPTKLHKRLVELMRASGQHTTLRVSQIASILGVEGDEQYEILRDQLARSRIVEFDAARQTVRSLLGPKDSGENNEEAALLASSAPDVIDAGRLADCSLSATALLAAEHHRHRSNSRQSYRGRCSGTAAGYRSDTALPTASHSISAVARRRPGGAWSKPGQRGLEDSTVFPGPVGRVGYVCVADELHLGKLEAYYRAQGYYTKFDFDVLHVRFAQAQSPVSANPEASGTDSTSLGGVRDRERTQRWPVQRSGDASKESPPTSRSRRTTAPPSTLQSYGAVENTLRDGARDSAADSMAPSGEGGESAAAAAAATSGASDAGNPGKNSFDLFIFPYGAVVWWGFDQRYFKIVENDYMLPHSAIIHCMTNRYSTQLVNQNYPVWCTFSLVRRDTLEVDDDFRARLRFDHFVMPYSRGELTTGSVLMLCASHALAQSAKIDYIELQVQELADSCSPLPRELRERGAVSITERRLLQLRGEVLSYRLMLKSGSDLLDEPDFFWENSYLKPVFHATKEEYAISERVEALDNKLDAANEILSMLAEDFSQRHGARLEWIVIWLVFVEVVIGVLELLVDVRPWFQSREG